MGNQSGFDDLIDVAFQREHGDIGIETSDDSPSLSARGSIRAAHTHVLPGFLFPMSLKGGDDVSFVGFFRHAVGGQDEVTGFGGLHRRSC